MYKITYNFFPVVYNIKILLTYLGTVLPYPCSKLQTREKSIHAIFFRNNGKTVNNNMRSIYKGDILVKDIKQKTAICKHEIAPAVPT